MARLEVRCCCDPDKLIGWVGVPDPLADSTIVPLRCEMPDSPPSADEPQPRETLVLEIANLSHSVITMLARDNGAVFFSHPWEPHYYRAVKSNDLPIETWRRVPGFEEATTEVLEQQNQELVERARRIVAEAFLLRLFSGDIL